MGRKKVTHETVNKFLNTLGYEWNYYIYDNVKDCYRRIAKTDFKKTTTLDCDVKRIKENDYINILDIDIPHLVIPVRPGRNLAIIIEVAAMNNRQKKMGYNAAVELNNRLMKRMQEESGF